MRRDQLIRSIFSSLVENGALIIVRKREALENVLVPYRIDENVEMIRRNGFAICETFFQYYNFIGLVCIKQTR